MRRVIGFLSRITFGAYILSWIPDKRNYAALMESVPVMQDRFKYFPIIVGKTILFSLAISAVIEAFLWCLNTGYRRLKAAGAKAKGIER